MKTYTNEERLEFAKNLKEERPADLFHASVKIGKNTVIGGDGFGYARDTDGMLVKMPHQGNVIIEENVEIGSNTCIDRAVIGSTVIGAGTKIDNLVHIAHGVKIGKNCLIVAGAVIGGSCEIGDNCFIGINASVKNKVKIGNNVTIGMGAVVLKDVPDGATVVGNPGRIINTGV
jgi:UDP-3-O-[3-hydroxymyristoyl] glucosamine N-acyltransferase